MNKKTKQNNIKWIKKIKQNNIEWKKIKQDNIKLI